MVQRLLHRLKALRATSTDDANIEDSLFIPMHDAGKIRPSEWPSATAGKPEDYGTRPGGAYIVNLDNDAVIPFDLFTFFLKELDKVQLITGGGIVDINDFLGDDISKRIPVMTIASSASPGGLHLKSSKGQAHGKYVVLPSHTRNVDIVFGNLAAPVYGIAAPATSMDTVVRTNVVLMTPEQVKSMDASEFASGNYTVAAFEGNAPVNVFNPYSYTRSTINLGRVKAIGYQGLESVFDTGNGPLAFRRIPASNRNFNAANQAEYFQALGEAIGLFERGVGTDGGVFRPADVNDFYSNLRGLYDNPETRQASLGIVNAVKKAMRDTGHVLEDTLQKSLGLRTVLDPYMRDSEGSIIKDNGKPVLRDYDPASEYRDFRLDMQF